MQQPAKTKDANALQDERGQMMWRWQRLRAQTEGLRADMRANWLKEMELRGMPDARKPAWWSR